MNDRLVEIFRSAPKMLVGVTRVAEEVPLPVVDLRWALSLVMPLSHAIIDTIDDKPTKLYKHHYKEVNSLLDQTALRLSLELQERGNKVLPIPASQIIDWTVPRGDVDHRLVAQAAGIGWIGRHGLLVTPEYGARQRLITILCKDNPSIPDEFLTKRELPAEKCGKCRACVGRCPGEAIGEESGDFNVQACHEVCADFSKRLVGVRICGVCIKQCRPKKRKS